MWAYEKKLQYPVKIKNPNPLYAKIIISQLGGPDGELGAALRYLNQRYTMPYGDIIGILTDVGTGAKCQLKNHSFMLKNLPGVIEHKDRLLTADSFISQDKRPASACHYPYQILSSLV